MRAIDADALKAWTDNYYDSEKFTVAHFVNMVKDMPTIEPERKTGRWLKISPAGIYECSECGKNVMTADIEAYEFCHGCGCRMMEVEHERR